MHTSVKYHSNPVKSVTYNIFHIFKNIVLNGSVCVRADRYSTAVTVFTVKLLIIFTEFIFPRKSGVWC